MNMNINCFCVPTADIDIRVENGSISLINGDALPKMILKKILAR
ncbi:MAG: hypothetical protein Ct9H90mP20_5490 [Candidatus Neomarinimicrobiota bacterium]|nr:MAG: hypothetical protein Ct9H90mP20_5490 [Candidatus Neomarinimicrobiota bacterium]